MDKLRLRRVLYKFRKEELYGALSEWDHIDIPPNLSKAQIISYITEESEAANITEHDVNRLELNWISSHSSKIKWSCYQLIPYKGSAVSHSQLENDFSTNLRPLLTHNINHCLVRNANWVLIRVKETPRDYSCYVVHHSRSDVVFLSSNVRKQHHKDAILLALCNTLACGDWVDMQLTGQDLPSLIQLTMNKHSQGSFSDHQPQYSRNTDNPLLLLHKRTHTVQEDDTETEDDVCRKAAERVFGKKPLPILESYTITVDHMQTPQHRTACKLKGTHILRGLEKAIITSRLTLPISDVIKSIPSLVTQKDIGCTEPG